MHYYCERWLAITHDPKEKNRCIKSWFGRKRRVMMPEEIKKAIEDVNVARNNLRHCNTENFDKCCIYLTAVEEKLNALIKYQKTIKKMVA